MFKTAWLLASFCCLTIIFSAAGHGEEPVVPTTTPPAADQAAKEKADAREAALQKVKAQREQLLKEMQERAAKEKAAALAKQAEYPYQSTKFLPVKNTADNGRLFSFCLGADEKLYCLVVPGQGGNPYELQSDKPAKPVAAATPEVVVLNLEGEELQRWPVGFKPDRITTTPQGEVYVGGTGKLAKYSAAGKLVREIELPHIAEALKDEAELKAAAKEEHNEQLEMYQSSLKHYEDLVAKKKELKQKELEKKEQEKKAKADSSDNAAKKPEPATKPAVEIDGPAVLAIDEDEELDHDTMMLRLSMPQLNSMLKNMQKQVDRLKDKTDEELLAEFKQNLSSKNSIHALSLAGDSLVYTTRQVRGYGFAVWKLNAELAEPVKIMQGLGGCCGQCDVQCHGDKLYVADNTKHRVTVYDLEGKKLTQYGKKGRDGDGENFGGCCNPMNVAFTPAGQILTAESEGYIKCFSPTGEFEALLGRSLLEAGCKHVALNMTKDSKYIVFLDQPGSRLVRLEKSAVPPKATPAADKTTSLVPPTDKAAE